MAKRKECKGGGGGVGREGKKKGGGGCGGLVGGGVGGGEGGGGGGLQISQWRYNKSSPSLYSVAYVNYVTACHIEFKNALLPEAFPLGHSVCSLRFPCHFLWGGPESCTFFHLLLLSGPSLFGFFFVCSCVFQVAIPGQGRTIEFNG